MKDKHSPLPWTLGEYNSIRAHGMRPGDKILVSGVSLPMSMNDEAEANSMFIVECVNRSTAFDALVEAAENAAYELERMSNVWTPSASRRLELLRAALSAAGMGK